MKKVSSKEVAIALIGKIKTNVNKMITYEQKIDNKKTKNEAEKRHINFLRALRNFKH